MLEEPAIPTVSSPVVHVLPSQATADTLTIVQEDVPIPSMKTLFQNIVGYFFGSTILG